MAVERRSWLVHENSGWTVGQGSYDGYSYSLYRPGFKPLHEDHTKVMISRNELDATIWTINEHEAIAQANIPSNSRLINHP